MADPLTKLAAFASLPYASELRPGKARAGKTCGWTILGEVKSLMIRHNHKPEGKP
jgi:hypothetical protein